MIRERWIRVFVALEAILLAVALGGIITMGAIAAPAIFRNVPAPYSGDGMAIAFARYDQVALSVLGLALVLEAARAFASRGVGRWDRIRLGCVCGALVVSVFIAMRITPAITSLHAQGAMRGVGELGEHLETIHRVASRAGKLELAFEMVALAMLAALDIAVPARTSTREPSP